MVMMLRSPIETAARAYVRALKEERAAEEAQRRLESESLRQLPDVTHEQIEAAGKRFKAARLTVAAALAVLEAEVDR